ncbi:MAG: AsmA family protein [Rickettsiales bacterium]|jgi:hypothetical protein|nr:AsmA family protein [Rickettsiales bacterium]
MKNKKRFFHFILRAVALFFGGLVVSLIIALSQVDLETLRKDISMGLEAAAGMPVEINGKVSWKFSLRPRAVLQDVRVSNAGWAKNKDGVHIETMVVTLDLLSLLRDRPVIQEMRLVNLVVMLEQNENGAWSLKKEEEREKRKEENAAGNKFPFAHNLGLESLELFNPKVSIIRKNSRDDWSLDFAKIKYKKTATRIEYSGFIEKNEEAYSFIAALSELDETRKIYPVRIAIASRISPLVINAALEANGKIPIDFIMQGTVSDLRAFGKIFNLDLPEIPKFDMKISGGFGHSTLSIHKSSFRIGDNDLSVSGVYDWNGKIPRVTAKIKSKNLKLIEAYPELFAPEKIAWVRPKRPLNVFNDVPLYSELMRTLDADISLDIKSLTMYRELAVQNVILHAALKDGGMHMDFSGNIAGGHILAAAHMHDDSGSLQVRAAGNGSGISAGDILAELREKEFISGLPVDFMFYLESSGHNLSELMANVTGPAIVKSVDSGRALSGAVDYFYGGDLLTELRHNVTDMVQKDSKYDTMRINCAAINIKLRGGRMETERGVAIETNEVNIRGTGFVDLGKEKLQASMITTPVRGLKLSLSGNIVNSMEFLGNMAEPDLKISRNAVMGKAVAATGVGLLLAPFTGGLSIAAGAGIGFLTSDLLANWLADDQPCKTALEKGAPARDKDPEFLNRPLAELVEDMIK